MNPDRTTPRVTEAGTPVQAMLFDLDGTLLDTAADFIYVVQQLCKENKHPPPDNDAIHRTVSSGARALVQMARLCCTRECRNCCIPCNTPACPGAL